MNINSSNNVEQKEIETKNWISTFFSKKFWDGVFVKLIETCISVKVWGLVSVMVVATWLLINKFIDGSNWTTVVTGTFGIIYGMREIFKISRIKELVSKDVVEKSKKIKV